MVGSYYFGIKLLIVFVYVSFLGFAQFENILKQNDRTKYQRNMI